MIHVLWEELKKAHLEARFSDLFPPIKHSMYLHMYMLTLSSSSDNSFFLANIQTASLSP